eukprot:Colp12_sorted_trinity150504_noHs@25110
MMRLPRSIASKIVPKRAAAACRFSTTQGNQDAANYDKEVTEKIKDMDEEFSKQQNRTADGNSIQDKEKAFQEKVKGTVAQVRAEYIRKQEKQGTMPVGKPVRR